MRQTPSPKDLPQENVQTSPPPTATPPAPQTEPSRPQTAHANWYTDTLRTIVNRALDADKPDIKGALAALAMLAEAEEPTEDTKDIANLLRDARKRAAHAKENTD